MPLLDVPLPPEHPSPSIETLAVHGRGSTNPASRKRAHDAVPTPIVCSATYTFASTAELHDHFRGAVEREEYGRYGNPTVRSAERAIAALENAEDAALFASGMAAITTLFFAVLKAGDHVVLTRDVYRRTRQFVGVTLSRFGVEATLVDPGDLEALRAAIRPGKTRIVFTELPTNPYLRVVDLDRVAELVREHRGVKLVVDATFATPVNLRALERGAHLVVHSCTKYLAGHNDVLAGAIAGSSDLVALVRDFRGVVGSVLDPHAAFLLERGMKTLALRVRTQNETAHRVAQMLAAHPCVRAVFYPSLPSHPDHAIAARLLGGFGGVISFRVRGDLEATSRFVDACTIPTIAPSLGGVETLIEQVALMSYYELSTEERLALGIHEDLVRLSVGIENAEDLVNDLDRALRSAISTAEAI